MMKNNVSVGKNRTGVDMSPIDKRALIDATEKTVPSMAGDESSIAEVRSEYLERGDSIGSIPPPASVKGAASTVASAVKGTNAAALLDKLGERLAFERTGTRLYGALIAKAQASEALPSGPSVADLEELQREELQHFEILMGAIRGLGGDPTSMTPSADVAGVTAQGVLQVIADPRMNLVQSLEAILVAELVDNDGWKMLIELARAGGQEDIAKKCEVALTQENEHLRKVRAWVAKAALAEVKPIKKMVGKT